MTLLALFAMSSCTIIVSKNVPGKKQSKIPSSFIGSYHLTTENEDLAYLNEANINLTFTPDGVEYSDSKEGKEFTQLGDSLYWSTYKKSHYISMGEGMYSIFKIEKSGKDILMYSLFANSDVKEEDLKKYFNSVEKDLAAEESGATTYIVEINDKKLAKFFQSGLVSKIPLKLSPKE